MKNIFLLILVAFPISLAFARPMPVIETVSQTNARPGAELLPGANNQFFEYSLNSFRAWPNGGSPTTLFNSSDISMTRGYRTFVDNNGHLRLLTLLEKSMSPVGLSGERRDATLESAWLQNQTAPYTLTRSSGTGVLVITWFELFDFNNPQAASLRFALPSDWDSDAYVTDYALQYVNSNLSIRLASNNRFYTLATTGGGWRENPQQTSNPGSVTHIFLDGRALVGFFNPQNGMLTVEDLDNQKVHEWDLNSWGMNTEYKFSLAVENSMAKVLLFFCGPQRCQMRDLDSEAVLWDYRIPSGAPQVKDIHFHLDNPSNPNWLAAYSDQQKALHIFELVPPFRERVVESIDDRAWSKMNGRFFEYDEDTFYVVGKSNKRLTVLRLDDAAEVTATIPQMMTFDNSSLHLIGGVPHMYVGITDSSGTVLRYNLIRLAR